MSLLGDGKLQCHDPHLDIGDPGGDGSLSRAMGGNRLDLLDRLGVSINKIASYFRTGRAM